MSRELSVEEIERLKNLLASFEWETEDAAFVHSFTKGPHYSRLEALCDLALRAKAAEQRAGELVEALDKLYKFTYGVLDRRRLQFKPEEYGPMKEAKEAIAKSTPREK